MTFSFWTGEWADQQFSSYQLLQFRIRYRSVEIPRQTIFDQGISAENEASLDFMGGENIRTYLCLLSRSTTDRVFAEALAGIEANLNARLTIGDITYAEYQELLAINRKAWNPLDAIRANVQWELKRTNDDRGWLPVKTIGDGRVNLVRYEFVLGTMGV